MAEPLSISKTPLPNGVRVTIGGDAGTTAVWILDSELTAIAAGAPPFVSLDLSGLTFITSAALGVMAKFRTQSAKYNGVVRIEGASPVIADAFRRAKLDQLFEFIPAH